MQIRSAVDSWGPPKLQLWPATFGQQACWTVRTLAETRLSLSSIGNEWTSSTLMDCIAHSPNAQTSKEETKDKWKVCTETKSRGSWRLCCMSVCLCELIISHQEFIVIWWESQGTHPWPWPFPWAFNICDKCITSAVLTTDRLFKGVYMWRHVRKSTYRHFWNASLQDFLRQCSCSCMIYGFCFT